MRIDFHYGPQATESSRSTQSNAATNSAATSKMPSGEDQTWLSEAHLEVQALAARACQLPEVREERVQSLRVALLSGRYQTSPEQTSGALLAHMAFGMTV
ncbi:MAG TPA: flagellar biosynthesis anti-sigma factor FlgM [Candidatus Sulfotelmatobacter sp.]|nr:flagellar biosynthesis anti-sigma factor FlgM [Candidatus Sulfotelmatobacter sp.]